MQFAIATFLQRFRAGTLHQPISPNKDESRNLQKPEWPKAVQPGRAVVRVYRRKTPAGLLHTLFKFGVARGYAVDNPVERVEKLKMRNGDVEIFQPVEMGRLLEAANTSFPAFLPALAIGGCFAGLRSAELERLEWEDIDLTAKHIVVAASKTKTASRRIVPIDYKCASAFVQTKRRWAETGPNAPT